MQKFILYIDDDEAECFLMEKKMQRLGITIEYATTVADGKLTYNPNRHIAAIIDWNLPDGDALDIAQTLKIQNEELQIYFISSLFTDELYEKANTIQPVACLEKSSDFKFIDEIANSVHSASNN